MKRWICLVVSLTALGSCRGLPVRPVNCTFMLTTTISDYANSPVTAFIFETSSLADMQKSPSMYSQQTANTDEQGRVTFYFQVPRGVYLGWTIFKDINNRGYLVSGDIVWGDKGAEHLYTYYWLSGPVFADLSRNYPDWDHTSGKGTSVWK